MKVPWKSSAGIHFFVHIKTKLHYIKLVRKDKDVNESCVDIGGILGH